MPSKKKLSQREKDFVQHFINNGYDASKAYRAAGGKATNQNSVWSAAYTLKNRPHVKEAIEKEIEAKRSRYEHVKDMMIEKYIKMFDADIDDFIDMDTYESMNIEPNNHKNCAIKKAKVSKKLTDSGDEFMTTDLELHDKVRIGQELAKLLSLTTIEDNLGNEVNITIKHVSDSKNVKNKDKDQEQPPPPNITITTR